MYSLLYFIVSLAWIVLFTAFLTFVFKKRSETVLPLSFIVTCFILYVFSFIRQLHLGYYVTVFACLLALIQVCYLYFKNGAGYKEFAGNYFTYPFFIFIILYVLIFIIYRLASFNHWDEFMYLGPMVREMVKHNTFYSISEATLHTHKDYPPFFALLGSLFCHFSKTGYSEYKLYIGQIAFQFSLFMPAFSQATNKNKKSMVLCIVGVLAVILAGFVVQSLPLSNSNIHYYNCILSDWALGLFTSYTFFVILKGKDDRFRYLNTALCLWVLITMKQMGIAFCLLAMLLFVIKELLIVKNKISKTAVISFAVFALAVVSYLVWQKYIGSTGAADLAQFTLGQIRIKDFLGIINGTAGEAWQHQAYVNFMEAIVIRKMFIHPVGINYIWSATIISAIILAVGLVNKDKDMKCTSAVFLFGAVCYCFAMLLLYIFSFGSNEGPGLASFNRYMFTFLFFGVCFLLMIGIYDSFQDERRAYLKIMICLILTSVFSDFSLIADLKPRKYLDSMYHEPSYQNIVNTMGDEKVLIVEQYSEDDYLYIMLDYDNKFANGSRLIRIGNRGWETPHTVEITFDQWKEMLRSYDYLFIAYADDYFLDDYFYPLTDEDFLNRGYYKITFNGDEIELELICTL